jgi:hypothetical protein
VEGQNELLLESVQAAETGPPRDLSEEAVTIGDWEGDRGAMEEARQILKEPVEIRRRIEDGGLDAVGRGDSGRMRRRWEREAREVEREEGRGGFL